MSETTVKKSWEETQTEKLQTALKDLGNSGNQICETLEKKKILGQVGDVEDCPVARYLTKVFKKAESISVDGSAIDITFAKGTISVKPPKAVSDFIEEFDEDDYLAHLNEDNKEELAESE